MLIIDHISSDFSEFSFNASSFFSEEALRLCPDVQRVPEGGIPLGAGLAVELWSPGGAAGTHPRQEVRSGRRARRLSDPRHPGSQQSRGELPRHCR